MAACLYISHGQLKFVQRGSDGVTMMAVQTENLELGNGEWHHVALTST